jgi:hypothetical protein
MAKFTSTNTGINATAEIFYFGETTTSGVWRIRSANGNLLFEKYDGASWNEKFTMDENGEPLLSIY